MLSGPAPKSHPSHQKTPDRRITRRCRRLNPSTLLGFPHHHHHIRFPPPRFLTEILTHTHHHSYVSPRRRAQHTLELLSLGCAERMPWQETADSDAHDPADTDIRTHAHVQVTEGIREWDYGDYEGLTSAQIREQRAERGEGGWDIWKDGCPGGE